jgi:biopolymer transport protein ExbD
MGELNMQSRAHGKRGLVRRSKKLSTRVDMTPMVDLGFLLITFFMVSTSWSKPKAINFILPADGEGTFAPASASLTIIPLNNDKVFYYHGSLQDAIRYNQYGTCNYSMNAGIGDVIRKKQFELDKKIIFKKGRKELIVMIKPVAVTDFKNIIKVFDEMLINRVPTYALTDISGDEKKLLTEKDLFN